MKTTTILAGVATAVLGIAGVANAAPAKRVQVDQHGDFALIGNTIGYPCQGGPPAPVLGTVGGTACSSQAAANTGDSSPDVFWRADEPGAGQAAANEAITPATARSTAVLAVPAGASVTHAYLYWGAKTNPLVAGTTVTLDRPGASAFTQTINAINSYTVNVGGHLAYQSIGDVTAIVQANGNGAYRVSGISTENFYNLPDDDAFAGWAMIVLYELGADPLRNLAVFDGLDAVYNGVAQNANLTGLLVPVGGQGKLGIVAYEGDDSLGGDQFLFNGVALTDGVGGTNNFFNGTRTWLGAAVSTAGDLPQPTGGARSMAGIDLDVVNITPQLVAGMTSAPIQGTSHADTYYLGAFVTSISTYRPDFTTSTKTAVDVNGAPLLAGEDVDYTITIKNTGNDDAINSVFSDPLPTGVTFKTGTITIDGVGKTDAANDDTAKYDAGSRSVVAWLGTGAAANVGGTIVKAAADIVIKFTVTVDPGVSGDIGNQAVINAAGALGAPAANTVTDGNGVASPGAPPTPISVDECASNANCTTAPKLICKTTVSPKICVACLADADCGNAISGKICNASNACVDGCRGTGNGCPASSHCTSVDATAGTCVACLTDANCGTTTSGKICNASNVCVDGCRGATFGNECPAPSFCTSTTATAGTCVACLTDTQCGSLTSGKVCSAANACIDGCRGATFGNGCPAGACSSTTATIGTCAACSADSDCGSLTSGKICTANACVDGCRGAGGNGCASPNVCTSANATAGTCVQCTTSANCSAGQICAANVCTSGCTADANCGSVTSGKICTANACVDGCRGTGGNGCSSSRLCTSTDATPGTCVACLTDANCGNTTSGKVCDAASHACVDGCRGTGGNGCASGKICTSTDATAGTCVVCTVDTNCGSGKVCDAASHACVDGCRGTGGGSCPNGTYCTSTDATAGTCVGCTVDTNCGAATSGRICDASIHACVDGCRGSGGNGCQTGRYCTSNDAAAGNCVACAVDAHCGNVTSAKVCDTASHTCKDGCRGTGGNGCAQGVACTSQDATIGTCVICTTDSQCGGVTSGRVCDTTVHACVDGCHGIGGNGCPQTLVCSSGGAAIGHCGLPDVDVVAQGNGVACSASRPASRGAPGWLFGTLLAGLLAIRRRRGASC
jgi:uncharacterized repeat protein (TIGR01451 family)